MKKEDRVELRTSYSFIDEVFTSVLEYVDDSLLYSVEELYHIEEYLPRELAVFINSLMCLPRIEED